MKTVHIKIDKNGLLTLDPPQVRLGHEDGAHALQFHNNTNDQATVMGDSSMWHVIFENPPAQGEVVVGGEHDAPKPALKLLPHDKRQNGTFDYSVSENVNGKEQTVQGQLQVRP